MSENEERVSIRNGQVHISRRAALVGTARVLAVLAGLNALRVNISGAPAVVGASEPEADPNFQLAEGVILPDSLKKMVRIETVQAANTVMGLPLRRLIEAIEFVSPQDPRLTCSRDYEYVCAGANAAEMAIPQEDGRTQILISAYGDPVALLHGTGHAIDPQFSREASKLAGWSKVVVAYDDDFTRRFRLFLSDPGSKPYPMPIKLAADCIRAQAADLWTSRNPSDKSPDLVKSDHGLKLMLEGPSDEEIRTAVEEARIMARQEEFAEIAVLTLSHSPTAPSLIPACYQAQLAILESCRSEG